MSKVSSDQLRKEVADILKSADLALVSSKKVREQVQERLKVNLLSRKKEFDSIVMDYISEQHETGNKKEDKEQKEEKMDEDDGSDSDSEYEAPKKITKPAKKKKSTEKSASGGTARKSTGFTKSINLSPELSALMGADSMPRYEVVKNMWAIIKERNLYDPKNKQYAICDDELRKIMKVKRFRTFAMLKHLKPHFLA